MSTATATKSAPAPTAHEHQAQAEADLLAADAAAEQARTDAVAARQAIADAEADIVAALADGPTRARIEQAQSKLAAARAEVEVAELAQHAADVRYSRAADLAAAAHVAVVRDEYLRAHAAHNDPESRENVLAARIAADVAELCELVDKRQAQHDHLAREYQSWPADERPHALPGRRIETYSHRGLGRWEVAVPHAEVAEAIKAGVIAAESAGT